MKILLTAATAAEITPLTDVLSNDWNRDIDGVYIKGERQLHIYITGVGMVSTAYHLSRLFQQQQYDLAIQAGIGGCFDKNLPIGDVVQISSDCFADFGAEDHDACLDIFELGLIEPNIKPFTNGLLPVINDPLEGKINLKHVTALTVNTVSGNEKTIARLYEKYGYVMESMEGAAFHYACIMEGVSFVQLRAISNYVEPRDKSKWHIPLAVTNLNKVLGEILSKF